MRLRKYLALLGVASLVLFFTGCGQVKEPISENEATSVVNSSIVDDLTEYFRKRLSSFAK